MKKSHINEIYDQNYAQNYNQRFLLNDLSKIDADFERETIAQLLNEIGDNPTLLDVACGTGYFLSCFPEVERAGLDISPAMLETAREANQNIPLIQGDYRDKRSQWEGKWDLVSCMWWAYCYVESLAELEKVVENFASWTSDRGICFVPIFHPSELGSGDMKLPYTSKDMGEGGGFYQFEGVIWSWIEDDRTKQHLNLIAPHPQYMISLFEKHFDRVEIVKYPKHERQRMALVARQKKSKHQRSAPEKTGKQSAPEKTGEQSAPEKTDVKFTQLVRLKEWWLYKIAPLLSIACAETLFLQIPPTSATLTTLTALISIASVAAYGYLLNDICDIESDRLANKPNAAAKLQPWQRILFCLLFLSTGFAAPLLTHLGTLPIALLTANYLVPTLYSTPPLRLKEWGIWGLLSDAAGAHLVPTLFVAAAFLSHAPDPPRNALIFTGLAAAHAFTVGLRGILLHQLWDRDNDVTSGTTTFVSQRDPEAVRQWFDRLVFPVEIVLLTGLGFILCQSSPSLYAFFVTYLLLIFGQVKFNHVSLNPSPLSPPIGQNIILHDLYEVWLPLSLAMLLASRNLYYLGFVVLMLVLFFPSVKNRAIGVFNDIRTLLTPAAPTPPPISPEAEPEVGQKFESASDDKTEVSIEMPETYVASLTPEMQYQLETEGYVVLENFLTPDDVEDLREFDRGHPLPEDMASREQSTTVLTSDLSYRKKLGDRFKATLTPKLATILPEYRVVFCPWFRKEANSKDNLTPLHQDPYVTDESKYLSLVIWCPLSDVDVDRSCLHVVKGSHKLNTQKRAYATFVNLPYDRELTSYITENYLTPIPLKLGQAILFDKKLFHGSSPNTSHLERVAATCFILIPKDAPLYLCYRESQEASEIEIYEVKDEFYNNYPYGDRPHGDDVKLIKTEPYGYDPVTVQLIVEKLDPLHPDRAIARFQDELTHPKREVPPAQLDQQPERNRPTTNVSPLTPKMQRQLESEGYVVLEEFLTSAELEDLREFDRSHPVPDEIKALDVVTSARSSDTVYRKKTGDKIKSVVGAKIEAVLPGYRTVFCAWFRKNGNSADNPTCLHQDPYFTDESTYKSLGVWCPLNDVDTENSCLHVVKGGHKLNTQKRVYHVSRLPDYDRDTISYIERNYLTPIPLKAGQAILFDKRLFHGAPPNTSSNERVATACFILIPENAPLYFCYRESAQSSQIETYEVPDDFYDSYILSENLDGYDMKLVSIENYTYDPLTPELIAKKLDPLHPNRAIARLKAEVAEVRSELQHNCEQQLETEGYIVLENFLTFEELEDLRKLVSTDPLPEDAVDKAVHTSLDQNDNVRQHHTDRLKAIVNPKLTTLLPHYRTAFCSWVRKSPNSSTNATPMHQDSSLTPEPATLAFGIWCPLLDVDPGNGCFHVVKGSHHLNSQTRPLFYYPFPYSDDIATLLREQYLTPIPLKAGQAILYDKRLFHSTTANPTDTERVAFTCLICPTDRPIQFPYCPTADYKTVEIYEVPDDFYNHHTFGNKPSGDGVKLIKTEPYTYEPLTPELIAEKLDPLHPERAINTKQRLEKYWKKITKSLFRFPQQD